MRSLTSVGLPAGLVNYRSRLDRKRGRTVASTTLRRTPAVASSTRSSALKSGDLSLWDELQGCDRYLAIVDPTWLAAERAGLGAVKATLLTDNLDAATIAKIGAWMARVCRGADGSLVVPLRPLPQVSRPF